MEEEVAKQKTTTIGGIDAVVHKKPKKKKKKSKKDKQTVIVVTEERPQTLMESLGKRRLGKPLVKDNVAWHGFIIGLVAGVIFPVFYVIFAEIEVTNIQQKLPSEVAHELPGLITGENFWWFSLACIIPIIIYSFLTTLCVYYLILSKKRIAAAGLFMMLAGPAVMLIIGLFTITH